MAIVVAVVGIIIIKKMMWITHNNRTCIGANDDKMKVIEVMIGTNDNIKNNTNDAIPFLVTR